MDIHRHITVPMRRFRIVLKDSERNTRHWTGPGILGLGFFMYVFVPYSSFIRKKTGKNMCSTPATPRGYIACRGCPQPNHRQRQQEAVNWRNT